MTAFCKSKYALQKLKNAWENYMKIKNIKKYVIPTLIVLAVVAVFALLFYGMSHLRLLDKGQIIAEYDGNPVYEAEVQDIINYQLVISITSGASEATDVQTIMQDAIKTYVQLKAAELDLKEQGYEIDEKALDEEFKTAKKDIEKEMTYNEWCKSYNVSKNFLKEELRRYMVASLYNDISENTVTVSTQEAKEYYNLHLITDYTKPAGYYWTSVIRPVKDITDTAEAAEAKAEMDAYLEKVKNGSMTFEQVDEELNKKYTKENGYSNALYDGEDVISKESAFEFVDEADYNDFLKALDEAYPKRNAQAKKDSEEYEQYMGYLSKLFQGQVNWALQHMEKGEIWSESLESTAGYYIVRLDRVETTNDFVAYEDVAASIIEILTAEKLQEVYQNYLINLEKRFGIRYYFS